MKLSKPEDDPNQPVRDDTDTTPSHGPNTDERTVEVTYPDGEMEELPMNDVVRVNREMLMNPTDFGLADNDAVMALFEMVESAREEREALRERADRLEAVIEMLATESEVLNGQCPNCGGVLEPQGGTFGGRRRVMCSECDRELTPNGTMR